MNMSGKKRKTPISYIVYTVLFFVVSVIPLAAFSKDQAPIGNEEEAEAPKLSDGTEFPKKADDYFSQKFGFRNRLVHLGNGLKMLLFKTSGQDEVIVGEEGWLFYASALKDYTGTDRFTQAQVDRIAVILKMMQDYVTDCGKDFIFFSAPNKMSVYGEYMPYYYREAKTAGKYEALCARLAKLGVHNVNLKNVLSVRKLGGVQLYHKLDSHWNNYGAAAAYEAVAQALCDAYGGEYSGWTNYTGKPYRLVNNFSGDLQSMLFPYSDKKDAQAVFDVEERFEYISRFRGPDDLLIITENSAPALEKSVTLFRDSFGNALYWFFAEEYASLTAKRESSYNIYQAVQNSDLIAVELVERNLGNLLTHTPVVPSKNLGEGFMQQKNPTPSKEKYELVMHVTTTADGLRMITGVCPQISDAAQMYLVWEQYPKADASGAEGQTLVYQLIPCEGEADFVLYIESGEQGGYDLLSGEGGVCFVLNRDGVYEKISANVTLQD